MGFLDAGDTLDWPEAKKYAAYVRQHGILQFLNIWRRVKDRSHDVLLWGDEVEYILIHVDNEQKTAKLALPRGSDLLDVFHDEEEAALKNGDPLEAAWRPEYGCFMLETTPGAPYGNKCVDFLTVEANMKLRRRLVELRLKESERLMAIGSFPIMGSGNFTEPYYPPTGPIAQSLYIPDQIIHPHKRFGTLTANIRQRRQHKVAINVPLFKDRNTLPIEPVEPLALKDHISSHYVTFDALDMDAMAFGMGCCCLQCTFQCCNIDEARYFYDQLAVLAPIMLALTASTPLFRGLVADTDVRWNVISSAVDDRTDEELGKTPLVNDKFVINKSRYGSVDCFISQSELNKPKYNDLDLVYDKDICQQLQDGGVDELLARHLAHLFIRDPLVIYRSKIEINDEEHSDHFENIQSTNWQTVRFKPPPPNSSIGWRVEFRPMEVQLTEFENAALSIFVVLLTRVISAYNLNFYTPISKVDTNMETAHRRGAVLNEKFYWRKHITAPENNGLSSTDEVEFMSVNDIINGNEASGVEGLIPLTHKFLDTLWDVETPVRKRINRYLSLISHRASGELQTTAAWMRQFVLNHPTYQHDSVVNPTINYDLMVACDEISHGKRHVPELFGDLLDEPAVNGLQ